MASFKKICKDNPHFFKVVLAHAFEEQKLEIPKKFVRQYGLRALSKNQTCLKVDDGREWDVGLTKSNGRVWFDRGWQNFVELYAVGLEYFLVFKYDKNLSNFNVVIFDLSATEIEYPTKQICVDEDEGSVKMETSLDDSCSQNNKVGEAKCSVKKQMNSTYEETRNPTSNAIGSNSIAVYKPKGRARATEEATAFQSRTLNPSFISKISPSCIYRRRLLRSFPPSLPFIIFLFVPKSFTKIHLEKTIETRVEVSGGREWNIRCCVSCTRMQPRAEFGDGLKRFLDDNNLKVGDACVFEMINKNTKTISFKVDIFRTTP